MTAQRRTLAEWANDWPYVVSVAADDVSRWTPLGMSPDCDALYREAFNLTDYFVSGVSGGSLWFAPRKRVLPSTGWLEPGEEINSRGQE